MFLQFQGFAEKPFIFSLANKKALLVNPWIKVSHRGGKFLFLPFLLLQDYKFVVWYLVSLPQF